MRETRWSSPPGRTRICVPSPLILPFLTDPLAISLNSFAVLPYNCPIFRSEDADIWSVLSAPLEEESEI